MSTAQILSVKHISKRSDLDRDSFELTNTVKVVFAGRILPSHVQLTSLRIQVRPFINKAMFCNNCQQFNHTQKYCKKKSMCAICQGHHSTSQCDQRVNNERFCPYCNTQHVANNKFCPHFMEVNECFKRKQIQKLNDRYTQAVSALIPAPVTVESNNTTDMRNFPVLHNRFSELSEPLPSTSTAPDIQNSASARPQQSITHAPRKSSPANPWLQF